MSIAATYYEPFHLVTVTWPTGEVYRLNTTGGPVIAAGHTWERESANGGSVFSVGATSESPDSYPNRDFALTMTDWIKAKITGSPSQLQQVQVTFQEAVRDTSTGTITIYPVFWRGTCDSWRWVTRGDQALSMVLVSKQALNRSVLAYSTVSPTFQDRLSPGDRAMDMTGARITRPRTDAASPTSPPGGGGIFVPGNLEWQPPRPPPQWTDAWMT